MARVIEVEHLSKRYLLGARRVGDYHTLREALVHGARRLASMPWKSNEQDVTREFLALQDVSFTVGDGDRVGIIGRNGAGKSTLLKILSRITEPSRGRISIKGRVASLLEVGTGFHPELTGRENIFLNGAILGMSRNEVRRKFDAIVDFAEVQAFLDTPVKRYSSGMYVRLAFAVAAHLEPDILIVDEVLAVGDADFQKKCLTKMGSQQADGRTVLFVSHNLGAVAQLCNSVIHLEKGRIVGQTNDVEKAILSYMGTAELTGNGAEWRNEGAECSNEWFVPARFYFCDSNGDVLGRPWVGTDEEINIGVEGECHRLDPALQVGVAVYASDGNLLFWTFNTDDDRWHVPLTAGHNALKVTIPGGLLNEGTYRVELGAALYHRQWLCEPGRDSPSLVLQVAGGFTRSRYWSSKRPGLLAPNYQWSKNK